MKFAVAKACTGLAALAAASSASAALITFTATGVADGQSYTATAVADTASKRACTGVANCFLLVNNSLTLTIAGVGTAQVLNPTLSIVNNATNFFSFSEVYSLSPVGIRALVAINVPPAGGGLPPSNAFQTYDLLSDLGPVATNSFTNPTNLPPLTGDLPIATTLGPLSVGPANGQQPVASTFTARLSTPAVPEPSAWAMMLAGFGLLGAALRRQGKRLRTALA